MRRILIAVALLALAPACASNSDVEAILALTGDSAAGQTVYDAQCAECHMADGTGNAGLDYPSLVGNAAEDSEIVTLILEGERAMPAFRDELTDQEIADVLAYIRATFG